MYYLDMSASHCRAPRARAWYVRAAAGVAVLALCLMLGAALSACGAQTPGTAGNGAAPTVATAAGKTVHFTTEDGVQLGGRLFGSGHAGVILCHMYPADQSSWYLTAQELAAQGYLVLTFDFRGYGQSGGAKEIDKLDRDVSAAVTEIRSNGAEAVVLAGASMGGTAALIAGDKAQALSSIRLAGIATLSAPVEFMGLSAAGSVPHLVVPLLFIAAEGDAGAAGARQLEQLSFNKGNLQMLPGSDHGTALLAGSQGAKVYQLLLAFIKSCLGS